MGSYLLPLLLAVPLLGAIAGAFVPSARAARRWALLISLLTLAVAAVAAAHFDFHQDLDSGPAVQNLARVQQSVQLEYGRDPLANPLSVRELGTSLHLGADSISLWLVLLTTFLMPLAIAASFKSITERVTEYYAWMLALLAAMLGVFVARDLLFFYVCFELTLIPMFFIIGIWGGPQRRHAAGKFFLFTFAGSVFTLAVVIFLGLHAASDSGPSFEINDIIRYAQSITDPHIRFWILLGLMAGFAVKIPLFPVHTWLPLAHTEAPTAGSVILAGVLLKLGTYGMLRLAVPIGMVGPGAPAGFVGFLGALCVIGIIYGALVAWVQTDIKKLVAYSSVSHLGFCVLGIAALNVIGLQGSVLYMINHGISTGAMFLCVGMIYDRYHTRDIAQLSGLARRMPILAFFFVLFTFSSIGLPGLNGFVSEFLTVLGAFTSERLGIGYAALAALGVILGAVYMLHMVACVIWGPLKTPGSGDGHGHDSAVPGDIGAREIAILVPLAIVVVVLGVMPSIITSSLRWPVRLAASPIAAVDSGTQTTALAATVKPRDGHPWALAP